MGTDAGKSPELDYQAAAERLLVVLSVRARQAEPPIAAGELAGVVFGELADKWSHETRRRRIRDTVPIARGLLKQRGEKAQIAADGRGYWLTGDPAELAWYAAKRTAFGVAQIADARAVQATAAHVAQTDLFPTSSPEIPRPAYRH